MPMKAATTLVMFTGGKKIRNGRMNRPVEHGFIRRE